MQEEKGLPPQKPVGLRQSPLASGQYGGMQSHLHLSGLNIPLVHSWYSIGQKALIVGTAMRRAVTTTAIGDGILNAISLVRDSDASSILLAKVLIDDDGPYNGRGLAVK